MPVKAVPVPGTEGVRVDSDSMSLSLYRRENRGPGRKSDLAGVHERQLAWLLVQGSFQRSPQPHSCSSPCQVV